MHRRQKWKGADHTCSVIQPGGNYNSMLSALPVRCGHLERVGQHLIRHSKLERIQKRFQLKTSFKLSNPSESYASTLFSSFFNQHPHLFMAGVYSKTTRWKLLAPELLNTWVKLFFDIVITFRHHLLVEIHWRLTFFNDQEPVSIIYNE